MFHCFQGDGFVPLHSAAYKGSIDFCRVLMDAGAELHTCNVKKETPQMVAKARGFPQLAELLAPPAVAADGGKDYAGRVQLHLAASRGELDVLTRVLKIHPSCVDAPDLEKFRRTALHKASLKGHTECVRVLVGAGADVNLLADDRWSSLHYASKEDHTEILQILFDAGADINAQKVRMLGLLWRFRLNAYCAVVCVLPCFLHFQLLHRQVDGFTPLHNAAFRGFIDSCRLLITLGADRVCRNHAGHTPSDVAKGKADQGGEKQRAVFEYIEALDKVDMPSAVEFTVLKVFTALMTSATPDECIDELKKLLNVVTRHGSGSVEWEKLRVICTRMRIAESALWTSEVARAFGKVARALNPAP